MNLENMKQSAENDPTYQQVKTAVINGFPKNRQNADPAILPYWNIRDELSIDQALIMYGHRIIIPKDERKETREW